MERVTDMTELTGRHVLAVTCSAFGVIIAVNMLLAYQAIATFPGLEVKNSYVASQGFDARRRAQEALGWTLSHGYDSEAGRISVALTDAKGAPAALGSITVLIGRATEAGDDSRPAMTFVNGRWQGDVVLAAGNWMLKVEATAIDGTPFERRINFQIRG